MKHSNELPQNKSETAMQMTKKQRLPESAVVMSTVNIPVEFGLEAPQARPVAVRGNFNNWVADQMPPQKTDCGRWQVTILLPANRCENAGAATNQTVEDIARQLNQYSRPALVVGRERKNDPNET